MALQLDVHVRVTGGRTPTPAQHLRVEAGTPLRDLLRLLQVPVEGSALWWDGRPVPSDLKVEKDGELEVVHTFSGG